MASYEGLPPGASTTSVEGLGQERRASKSRRPSDGRTTPLRLPVATATSKQSRRTEAGGEHVEAHPDSGRAYVEAGCCVGGLVAARRGGVRAVAAERPAQPGDAAGVRLDRAGLAARHRPGS